MKKHIFDFTKRNLAATADEICNELKSIKADYASRLDSIRKVKNGCFKETYEALAAADGEASFRSITCVLPSLTSACKESRSASADAKKQLAAMWTEAYSCPVLYKVLQDMKGEAGDDEGRRLIEVVTQRFNHSGAHLDDKSREAFLEPFMEVSADASKFEMNINEDVTTVAYTEEELDGLPQSFIDALPKTEELTFIASIKAPVRLPIMQQAHSSETRRTMQLAASSACKLVNGPLLDKILLNRNKAAKAAGFPNHAEYILRTKTAGNLHTASSFCYDMLNRMKVKLEEERAVLKKHNGGKDVETWDVPYLAEKIRKEEGIDTEALKKYFPLKQTLNRILGIYADLLGLIIAEDTTLPRWCDDVLVYTLTDEESGKLQGRLYLDLFPREGKFGHQMILPLAPTFEGCVPACCYMGNISKPEGDEGALLRVTEVNTMFHELGHVMHCLCTETRYSILSWAWPMVPWPGGVEQDFLEVPSTMFEQWMMEPEVVERVSGEVDGKKIDLEVVKKLKATRHLLAIVERYSRYYAMSVADLRMHASGLADAQKIYADTMKELIGVELQAGTNPSASWYHPVIGYDAGYYGYGWAEVYAQDLFTEFKKRGLFDKETGRKLRRTILAPCATRSAPAMLQDFLGRAPSNEAYCAELGIADC
eukprot:TRINITY_DN19511_c0_g1_i1.p1 TRINITY_DN19511_c0_g1~~TRINITY_DN19511_c0_g1_i1.p1  ORF type:complete len:653 (+),score=199.56 TRINITY_DN19511_c0_g1_i1:31-1989(+)